MELAGRGAGVEAVRRRGRSVLGRATSGHRHRRAGGVVGQLSRDRRRRIRGTAPARRTVPDDPNGGRLLGHARAPRVDRSAHRDSDRRRRGRRHGRAERRARSAPAVRSPRRPSDGGPERLRRSALAASRPASPRSSATGLGAGRRTDPSGLGPRCGADETIGTRQAPALSGCAEKACPTTVAASCPFSVGGQGCAESFRSSSGVGAAESRARPPGSPCGSAGQTVWREPYRSRGAGGDLAPAPCRRGSGWLEPVHAFPTRRPAGHSPDRAACSHAISPPVVGEEGGQGIGRNEASPARRSRGTRGCADRLLGSVAATAREGAAAARFPAAAPP